MEDLDPKWIEHVRQCDMPFCREAKKLLEKYEELQKWAIRMIMQS